LQGLEIVRLALNPEPATGPSSVVHDLAPLGVPVDASVHAGILTARIGDTLAVVTPPSGATSACTDTNWILGSVALAPDGVHLAIEVQERLQPKIVDLYLFEVP
jgi:hypothetical protein